MLRWTLDKLTLILEQPIWMVGTAQPLVNASTARARDPASEICRRVVAYGHVTLVDSLTVSSMFRADTSVVEVKQWCDYDLNTVVNFAPSSARKVIDDDVVTVTQMLSNVVATQLRWVRRSQRWC